MKNGKEKNIIIALLVVIIIILASLVVLFATDTITFNSIADNNNELSNENINEEDNTLNDNVADDNNSNQTQEENNNEKIDESNFVRETRITLVDEPDCTGNSSPLIAAIEPNGNISIAQGGGAVEIKVGNAKYLYRVGILACANFELYYITEDKELYVIDNPNSTTLDQKATKATESKVIEFLGVEGKSDGSYLKVLLESGEIEYIQYFTSPN